MTLPAQRNMHRRALGWQKIALIVDELLFP